MIPLRFFVGSLKSGQGGNDLPPVPSRDLSYTDLYGSLLDVITPNSIQASSDRLFRGIFSRDALRVALDLLPWHPKIAEMVLYNLARLQGVVDHVEREEEPGRIHHEYRALYLDGKRVSEEQEEIMKNLAERWGWVIPGKEMCYYGSVDATPQFVRLVARYVELNGRNILADTVLRRDGTEVTIGMAVLNAMGWLERRIERSSLGLLEFHRANPHGIRFQVMRDGAVSYLHEDGTLANHKAPIASLEVQGLSYDALVDAATLFAEELPERAERWKALASAIQTSVFERFWMDDRGQFAMAIDRDAKGNTRLIQTQTSVPAELLETGIFDSLPQYERMQYLAAIVCSMYSKEILTDVGIRSRGLQYANLLAYWDYQGSYTSWLVTTNVFAVGLRRQGLTAHAADMEARLINGTNIAGCLPEFFYVDDGGGVHYNLSGSAGYEDGGILPTRTIQATNHPELNQAWSISAILRARRARTDARHVRSQGDEQEIKRRTGLPRVRVRVKRGAGIPRAYPRIRAALDREGGFQAEHAYLERVLSGDGG